MLSFGVQLSCSFIYLSSIQINICSSQNVNSSIKRRRRKQKHVEAFLNCNHFVFGMARFPLVSLFGLPSIQFNSIECKRFVVIKLHSFDQNRKIDYSSTTNWLRYEGFDSILSLCVCVFAWRVCYSWNFRFDYKSTWMVYTSPCFTDVSARPPLTWIFTFPFTFTFIP